MLGYILILALLAVCFYAVASNFGVRGCRRDGKFWWKR